MSSTQEVGSLFVGPAHAMLRSPTVLIASVGLWGMNVYFYRLFGIDYIKVLKYDVLKIEQQEQQQSQQSQSQNQTHEASAISTATSSSSSTSKRKISSEITTATTTTTTTTTTDDSFYSEADDGGGDGGGDRLMDDDSMSSLISVQKDGMPPLSKGGGGSTSSSSMMTASDAAITWERLVGLSITLLFLLHSTYFWWINIIDGGLLGAVYMFYGVVLMLVVVPLQCSTWLRRATSLVLHRSWELINPRCHCLKKSSSSSITTTSSTSSSSAAGTSTSSIYIPRPIPFVDVFFADAMCSLSKVFFDWGMLLLMAYYGGTKALPRSLHTIVIPSLCAAVPYLIRARQCLIMYTHDRLTLNAHATNHLWNALKYSTSIFPLCLSAFQKTVSRQREKDLEVYLIFLLVLNSTFALYWDVVMDWGMYPSNPVKGALCGGSSPQKPPPQQPQQQQQRYHGGGGSGASMSPSCTHVVLRPRLRFGVSMSALILVVDMILRFSWMLRFANKSLFPSQDSFVLCTQFLEVFRRALWNLLRVEWENLKQLKAGLDTNKKSPMTKGGSSASLNGSPPSSSSAPVTKKIVGDRGERKSIVDQEMVSFLPKHIQPVSRRD